MVWLRTATVAIALLTVAAFILTAVIGAQQQATLALGFIPARWTGLVDLSPAVPALLTPFSSTLVHGSTMHLALNILILLWCGINVERVLGRGPLIVLYLVGAFVAAFAQWGFYPLSVVPMIGASGAISAVIGAFALSFGQQKRIVGGPALNRMLNSLWLLAAWVVIQALVGWTAGMQGVLLATPAHVGGFIAGILLQRPLLLWSYRSA